MPNWTKLFSCVVTNFSSLSDFDKKSIKCLPSIYKNVTPTIKSDTTNNIIAESSIARANISSISVSSTIEAVNAAKNYGSIDLVMSPRNVNYSSILITFKIKCEAHFSMKGKDEPKVPNVNIRNNYMKIARWVPIFEDCIASSCVSRRTLSYVLSEDTAAPDETMSPLLPICYYGESRNLISELVFAYLMVDLSSRMIIMWST